MKKEMSEAEQEQSVLVVARTIFDKFNPSLLDKETLNPRQVDLYEKSLFAGIATAVGFVIILGDSLSKSDREGLSHGRIPDYVSTPAFKGLIRKLPKLRRRYGERNFCFNTFYAGIGVAIAFMESEFGRLWE